MVTYKLSSYKTYYTLGVFLLIASFFYFRYLLDLDKEAFDFEFLGLSFFYLVFVWAAKGVFTCRSVDYNTDYLITKRPFSGSREMIPLESIIYIKKTSFRSLAVLFEYKIKYRLDDTKYFYTMIDSSTSFDLLISYLKEKNPAAAKVLKEDTEIPFT